MDSAPASPAVERFERRALGSRLRLTTVGLAPEPASAAWADVGDTFDDVDRTMSRFRPDSEISQLNRSVASANDRIVSRRLYEALALCERAGRATKGRFDPRILVDLERLGSIGFVADDRTPTTGQSSERATAPRRDLREPGLHRTPRARAVRLTAPVDLGGIGKGLALRWARDRVVGRTARPGSTKEGALGLLIDAGGDLVVAGCSPEGGAWRIAIEDPSGGDDPKAVLEATNGAVATSSVRIGRWTSPDGDSVHHLIDPASGRPAAAGLQAVTVWWPDPAWAEVWTKMLFIAGMDSIASEAESRGLAAWWIGDDGHLGMTSAAESMTIWS